jgi:hypothetical protein
MPSTEDRYRDDFEIESRSTDENKPSPINSKPSVSFLSILISLILLCLALLLCNVTLYTQNQRLKLAANDDGFSKSQYIILSHHRPDLTHFISWHIC